MVLLTFIYCCWGSPAPFSATEGLATYRMSFSNRSYFLAGTATAPCKNACPLVCQSVHENLSFTVNFKQTHPASKGLTNIRINIGRRHSNIMPNLPFAILILHPLNRVMSAVSMAMKKIGNIVRHMCAGLSGVDGVWIIARNIS